MEENEYRETYQEINTLPCIFERAILVRCAGCGQARRLYLAEREAVACRSIDAQLDCAQLLELMHDNARFVLRQPSIDAPLPHAKEVRVQCGGIRGLGDLVDARNDAGQQTDKELAGAENIHALIRLARQRYGNLQALPFQDIVLGISRWQSRRRGKRPPKF